MSQQPEPNKATKPKFVRPITVWMGVLALCLALITFMLNRTELAEAYERVTCGKACPSLTAEELRVNVIKAYLHYRLNVIINWRDYGHSESLALLPVDLTAESLAQGIQDSTLLATLTTNGLLLQTHAQIDALEPSVLVTHPSITKYSLYLREAEVIPMRSIRPASPQEMQAFLQVYPAGLRRIGRWERLRGYGQHFFWISEYWGLSLACCDGKGDENEASTVSWLKLSSLKSIQAKRSGVFAVSDRGAIFFWQSAGENGLSLSYRIFRSPRQQPTFKEIP